MNYAQAVGYLGAVAPSKRAIRAWRDLGRRAKGLLAGASIRA